MGMKRPYFVNFSIMTMLPSFPSDLGQPVIKSILMVNQAPFGMVIGSNSRPGGCIFSPLEPLAGVTLLYMSQHICLHVWPIEHLLLSHPLLGKLLTSLLFAIAAQCELKEEKCD